MLIVVALMLAADAPAAGEIMSRMAANFESAAAVRRTFVYQQRVRSSMVRVNGVVARREKREYLVTPGDKDTEKRLTAFEGEYRKGKRMIPYTEPGFRSKGLDLDGDLIRDLNDELTNSKDSRDGIPHDLFPLTAKDQRGYEFTLKGEEMVNGRKAWRIAFEPAKHETCVKIGSDSEGSCDSSWKGDVWVDMEDFQPARIMTDLAFRIPVGVRVFLGTDLRRTGFSLTYERVAPGVWFPKTYGTEFRLDVLWGYKRTITLSLESSGFQKTEATSKIEYKLPVE